MSELASAARVATTELRKAIQGFNTRQAKRVQAAAAADAGPGKGAKSQLPKLIEIGMDKGIQILTVTSSELITICSAEQKDNFWSVPILVKFDEEHRGNFSSSAVKAALENFKVAFNNKIQQQERAGEGKDYHYNLLHAHHPRLEHCMSSGFGLVSFDLGACAR